MNKVILAGHLGQDVDLRFLPTGVAVATLSLATSKSYKDKKSGERKTVTEWHRVVMFNKSAETLKEYTKKGSHLLIEGELRTRKWEKDGVTQYTTEVLANGFEFLDKKPSGESKAEMPPKQPQPEVNNWEDFDDDIPFN